MLVLLQQAILVPQACNEKKKSSVLKHNLFYLEELTIKPQA